MKKNVRYLALVLTMVMLLSAMAVPAWAAKESEEPSDEESFTGLDELEFSFEETVLVDNDDIYVSIDEFDPEGDYGPTFSVTLENRTEQNLRFSTHWGSVNDVLCPVYLGEEVKAGKKAYSEIEWDTDDLAARGINYIEDVELCLWVYDSDDYSADDIYDDVVSWSVANSGTDVPSVEPVTFGHGFEPIQLLRGMDVTLVDFDPDGYYGPTLTFLLENRTDKTLVVGTDDVSVNGVMCEPYWSVTVPAGKTAYSQCSWWEDDLEDARIETMETVELPFEVYDDDTYDTMATFTAEISLEGAGELLSLEGDEEIPAVEERQEPGDETEGYVGDTLRTAFFDFTVNDAWLCDEYEDYAPSEGNTLVVVDLSLYNYTSSSVPMYDTDFQVCWGTGDDEFAVPVTYPRDGYPNTGVEAMGDMLPDDYSIGIHKDQDGILLYEVPQGIEDFVFAFQEVFVDDSTGDTFYVYFTPEQR